MEERKRAFQTIAQPPLFLTPDLKRSRSCSSSNSSSISPRRPSSIPIKQVTLSEKMSPPVSDTSIVKIEEDDSPKSHTPSDVSHSNTESLTYCCDMMKLMDDFRKANILCDVTLCVDGTVFFAHKPLLAAASPYFKAIFSSDLNKCSENTKPIILTEIGSEHMETLLDYIYTGHINLTKENINQVLSAANFLLLSSLKSRCTSFLEKILSPANCLVIESTAEKFDCEALKNTATHYVHDNFITIANSNEFLHLEVDRLIEIVSSDDTKVEQEEQVFEAIMNWVKFDIINRRRYFKDLVTHVRFPLISPYYLMDHVESEDLVCQTPECISLLLEAKNYHMLPDRRWQLKSKRTTPRISMGIVNGIIAVGGIQDTSVVASTSCYLLCANQWFVLAKMQTPRCRHGLAVTGEFVYAVGGQYREGAAQSSLNNVERYDPKTNNWSVVASMLTRRSLLNVVALEGFLYAVGGCDENNMRLNSVERYNPATNTWSSVPGMSASRSSPGVVAHKYLYVIGGVSYVGMALNCGEKYDPHTNTWSEIAPMSCSRASACCAAVNGKIYVIGGWDGKNHLSSAEVYQPELDEWSFISSASTARWDAGVAVNGDKIYVVGGCDRNAVCTLQTECYDTITDTWTQVASLPVASHGLKCCTIQLPNKFV
ncbi:kelch-like protein diablo isoform X2 [Hydra vulgaris]|uniref:Kelch-like protein diablo isoform X2 n=1 Tax=Hydra vulgaris TaxID=6087 RepID=A0ABM4DIA4_HYDVU|nr:kelch-like protein diablo isoform X2 [Hydra vulgaris]